MKNQLELFKNIPEQKKDIGITCRTCLFRYKHEYGKMFYCSKIKSSKTAYGHKKIKAGNPACHLYKRDE